MKNGNPGLLVEKLNFTTIDTIDHNSFFCSIVRMWIKKLRN